MMNSELSRPDPELALPSRNKRSDLKLGTVAETLNLHDCSHYNNTLKQSHCAKLGRIREKK